LGINNKIYENVSEIGSTVQGDVKYDKIYENGRSNKR
jgi:hypothetical protein